MRGVTFAEGEFYHLYNRGVDKRVIFTTPYEYTRFLAYLYLLNDEKIRDYSPFLQRLGGLGSIMEIKPPEERIQLVSIGAYCLMPNHFHLYVTTRTEGGISRFMQRVQTAYTMYFNEKHERAGALFEGTFKAKHVDSDEYARYLLSYIHLNPAKLEDPKWKEHDGKDLRKLKRHILSYPYSSIGEYATRHQVITDSAAFPQYVSQAADFEAHIDDWLNLRPQFGG